MEPIIVKQGDIYRLKVGRNLYVAPCNCKKYKGIHFHHAWQGESNPKSEMRTLTVDLTKEYPNG